MFKLEKKEKIIGDKLGRTQTPQLISAIDKKSHLMKIVVIQPPITGDPQGKRLLSSNLT